MTSDQVPWILSLFALIAVGFYLFERWRRQVLAGKLATKDLEIESANRNAASVAKAGEEKLTAMAKQYADEVTRVNQEVRQRLTQAQELVDKEREELRAEAVRIRAYYEAQLRQSQDEADAIMTTTLNEISSLRKFQTLRDAEADTRNQIQLALKEAAALRADAETLLDSARIATKEERSLATKKAQDLRLQADQILDRATRSAARIVEDAHRNAEQIAGDAYVALRDKQGLEQAVQAIRNIIDGYGDRYVVPTHSLIDELASSFEHTEAGKALVAAREQSKRMVEENAAAACDYVEADRRNMAIRFVIDAFNGRVDALLTEAEHENHGTLEQRIRDAFSVVNLNGRAFRDARILPAYLDARLAELKWAVITYELREKQREEQRRIKEQIREEEKVRREYERAMKEAQAEEEKIQQAIARAQAEVAQSNAQERSRLELEIAALNDKLLEAEAKNQRVKSMAEQTRVGNVYVISNIGSFGDDVFKIGMTRRIVPMDRIWELSDASVPFDFDVHAMIPSQDAPALEAALHAAFDEFRINKVNYRKEFFRVSLEKIRSITTERNIEASFTLLAEAQEFRETQALNKMSPAEREKYEIDKQTVPVVGSE